MCPSRNILKASKTKRIKKKKKDSVWALLSGYTMGKNNGWLIWEYPYFCTERSKHHTTIASDQHLFKNKRNDGTDLLTNILYSHMTSNVWKIETLDCSEFYNGKWLLKERCYVAFSLFHQVQLWATDGSYMDTEVSANHNLSIQLSPGSWGAHPWDRQLLRDGFREEGSAPERQVHWALRLERWVQGRGVSPGKTGALASRAKTEVEGATGAG